MTKAKKTKPESTAEKPMTACLHFKDTNVINIMIDRANSTVSGMLYDQSTGVDYSFTAELKEV